MDCLINVFHDCINDFNSKYSQSNNNCFRITQWNIRGMNDLNKFDNISLFLDSVKVPIDIFVVGETWLKSNNCGLYNIPGYSSVFSCRNSSSGGLAVYVKIGLSFKVLKNIETDGFHLIHVEIERNGFHCEVVGVYRPPSFDFNQFHDEIENILSAQTSYPRFFVGDMNIPINLSSNNIVVRYKSLLESYNYACSNTFVTRPISSNILDHFVCRNDDLHSIRNDTIYTDVSDHIIIVSSFKIKGPKENVVLARKVVDKSKLQDLFTVFLHGFDYDGNVNNSLTAITNMYNTLLAQCTTTKSVNVKVKSKHCPWLNYHAWHWMKLKHKYLKKVKNDPNNEYLKDLLKHVSKRADDVKRGCKREYYRNLLENTCHAKLWKNLNEIMGRSKTKTCFRLKVNGVLTSNNLEVCETFNNFFSQIGSNLANKIPKNNSNPLSNSTRLGQSVFLGPANENEVLEIIKELNVKKSNGSDNFPTSVVKNNAVKFSNILAHLFNQMLEEGTYPECLKIAKVTPIFKCGETTDPCNYRPISTLSVFSKILEKLLVKRIVKFLNKHNILYKFQYGFRKGCSTSTAMVELVDYLIGKIDNKCVIGGLFIDLKKAFDTLNHNILLQKLEYCGIRGTANNIIRSYLKDRQQYVAIEDSRSSIQTCNIGVPQGSNIGPLLFLIYINDLGNLPLIGTPRLFADDTAIFYPSHDPSSIISSMKNDLRILIRYFDSNLLSLNLSKTKYMLFHSPRKKVDLNLKLCISQVEIERVYNFKYLGLVLDPVLSWGCHIDQVLRKVSTLCGLMFRVRSFVPRNALLKFYFGCIHSHLQYLIIVWGHACKSKLKKLQVLQNRCLKIIYLLPRLYPTQQLYTSFKHNALPIRGLCDLQSCLFIYDTIKNPDMHHNLTLPSRTHNHNTRHANNLARSRAMSNLGQTRITFYGPSAYNNIPERLKTMNNRLLFKTNLKLYYRSKINTLLI